MSQDLIRGRTLRRALRIGASALVIGFCCTANALAQEKASEEPVGLEEVVVTAEKRREGLQNVPIAITAVSGETLNAAGVQQAGDLVQIAPSLQFGERFGNVFFSLRGIGQAGQDIGNQSGVSVSQDGVPYLSQFMLNATFLDVERVEVLRGPQGTIAGRNATGGAINIYNKRPTDEIEGEVAATIGNYELLAVRGIVSGPILSDRLLGRIALQSEQADGWLTNAYLGVKKNDTDRILGRATLLGRIGDTFEATLGVEVLRDRSDPQFVTIFGRARAEIPMPAEVLGLPMDDIDNLTVYTDKSDRRDIESFKTTLNMQWDLSHKVRLASVSSYIDYDLELTNLDNDGTIADRSDFPLVGVYQSQLSQELTLTADISDRFDLIAGVYYLRGDSREDLILNLPALPEPNNDYLFASDETLDSYAVYGQARFRLTDALRITAGGRYTTESKTYENSTRFDLIGYSLSSRDEGSWDAFTPRVVVDYAPSDKLLAYVSASRGFKAGGFRTFSGTDTDVIDQFDPEFVWNYEAGVKARLLANRVRVGGNVFYMDYTNLQQVIFRFDPVSNRRVITVENASAAHIQGLELEFDAIPFKGLYIMGSGTLLEAQLDEASSVDPILPATPSTPPVNLTGNRLPQAPSWQYSLSAEYRTPISDKLSLRLRADYRRQGKIYFDVFNDELNTQKSYGLLNLSATLESADGDWQLTAFGRNVTDTRYISQALTASDALGAVFAGGLGAPRMYGLSLARRF
jgi:iron complex outermembrane recepter protein